MLTIRCINNRSKSLLPVIAFSYEVSPGLPFVSLSDGFTFHVSAYHVSRGILSSVITTSILFALHRKRTVTVLLARKAGIFCKLLERYFIMILRHKYKLTLL